MARRLQQVIWNLVHNAIKFTPDQGGVEVAVTRTSTSVQIRVTDNGQGISPDFLPLRLRSLSPGGFLSDTRGVGARNRAVDCEAHRRAARGDHRGRERGPGEGSTFIVHLPASRLETAAGGVVPMPGVHGAAAQDGTLHSAAG